MLRHIAEFPGCVFQERRAPVVQRSEIIGLEAQGLGVFPVRLRK